MRDGLVESLEGLAVSLIRSKERLINMEKQFDIYQELEEVKEVFNLIGGLAAHEDFIVDPNTQMEVIEPLFEKLENLRSKLDDTGMAPFSKADVEELERKITRQADLCRQRQPAADSDKCIIS